MPPDTPSKMRRSARLIVRRTRRTNRRLAYRIHINEPLSGKRLERDAGHMSIRQWPESERPREKLLAHGSARLSDAELLAVLLGSGVRGKDAITLGRELLMQAGGLNALLARQDGDIRAVGLGPAKRARLAAALELARRSLAEQLVEQPSLRNPHEIGRASCKERV